MARIKSKVNVSNTYIDKSGELHIVTQHGEIVFKDIAIEQILMTNFFQFQGRMHKLFKREHLLERERLMRHFYFPIK